MSKTDPLVDVPIVTVNSAGVSVVHYRTFVDVAEKVDAMHEIADSEAMYFEPVATAILVGVDGPIDALRRAHDWISRRVAYCPEDEEILISARRVLQRGCGSCGHHAIMAATLVRALDVVMRRRGEPGVTAAIVTMGGPCEDPEHASALVAARLEGEAARPGRGTAYVSRDWPPYCIRPFAGAPNGWRFSETSEPAMFGEEPYRAALRMGGSRARLTLTPARAST